eukprot:3454798-Pleurochrysis_carterae.AAC.4
MSERTGARDSVDAHAAISRSGFVRLLLCLDVFQYACEHCHPWCTGSDLGRSLPKLSGKHASQLFRLAHLLT